MTRFAELVNQKFGVELVRPATAQVRAFRKLVEKYPATSPINPADADAHTALLKRLNAGYAQLSSDREDAIDPGPWINAAADPLIDSQLTQFVLEVERLASGAERAKTAVKDYGDLMRAYVALLRSTDRAIEVLLDATARRQIVAPPINDFIAAAIKIRTLIANQPK